MNHNIPFQRLFLYFFGFFIMTAGVALSVKSDLGVSPISSIPYTVTCVIGLEMGKATILFHIVLVFLQIILLGRNFQTSNLLQIPVGVVFGSFTTLCNYYVGFLATPDSITIRILMVLTSTLLIAFGLFLYVPAGFVPLAGEGAMLAISQKFKFEFSSVKVAFDCSMVLISLFVCLLTLHSTGSVGVGTILAAFLVGNELKLLTKHFGPLRDALFHLSDKPESSSIEHSELYAIMKTDVYTIKEYNSIQEALQQIVEKKVSGMPVINADGQLTGFLSDGDIIAFLAREHPLFVNPYSLVTLNFDEKLHTLLKQNVARIAKKPVITVNIGDCLEDVCYILSEYHIKKAPVMYQGQMIGIINRSNLTTYVWNRSQAK